MPTERAIRLNQIAEANKPIINRVRSVCEQIAPLALNSLSNPTQAQSVIDVVTHGIINTPEYVEIRGISLDSLKKKERRGLAAALKIGGLIFFSLWHDRYILGQKNPPVVKKIIDRDVDHFIEGWVMAYDGKFPEPDWKQIEEAHEKVMSGSEDKIYGPYVSLFHFMQVSAVEQFLEETLPPEFPFFTSPNTVLH